MLRRLVYVSQAAPNFKPAEVLPLLESARIHNIKNAVTGLLYFDGAHFLQMIEGATEEVSETFQRLSRDPRHHTVRLLHFSRFGSRGFPDGMGHVAYDSLARKIVADFTGDRPYFVPEALDDEQSVELMLRLRPLATAY